MSAPIPALSSLRPIAAEPRRAGVREAQVGELLRLRVALAADGGLLGEGEDGLQLGLPPGLARSGDLLLLRVLTREPRLELELLQREAVPAVAAGPASGDDEWGWRALRPDQGRLQRWHQNQDARLPAQMAVQWRAQALAEQLRVLPGPALQALSAEAVLAAHAAPLQLAGWAAQGLWLRLLAPLAGFWPPAGEEDVASEAEAASSEGGLCLSLSLLTAQGWVLLLLQWRHGLLLHLCAESADALPWLRARMPAVARALAAVPVRIRHCSLGLRQPPLAEAGPGQRAQGLAAAASQPLFRAAAEVVRVLQG